MSTETSGKMSIEDAIRLKHELNQTIAYCGYNAKKVQEMENLTEEQHAEVNRQLSEIRRSWWFFPDYVWVIGIVAAGFCRLYFFHWIIHIAALMAMIYCVVQLGYRAGVSYGYVRGYESGHEEGVHKALGISGDDASDISERAVEMEMDEMLIKNMDDRKKQSP